MLKFRIPSRVYASNLKLGEMGTVQLQIASIRFDSFKVFTKILFFQTLNSLDKKALRGCIKSPIYQSHEQWSWKSYSFSHLLWINSRIFLFVSAKSNNNNPYWMLCPEIGIKMLHQMMFDFDKQPFFNWKHAPNHELQMLSAIWLFSYFDCDIRKYSIECRAIEPHSTA